MNDLHISESKSTISRVIKADPNIINKEKKNVDQDSIKMRDWTGPRRICIGKFNDQNNL